MHLYHCKVQTAFVSLFYIFINMKYGILNIHYPGTRRVVKSSPGSLLTGYPTDIPGYPRQPYTRAFNEFLRIFLISENSLKFAIFLLR